MLASAVKSIGHKSWRITDRSLPRLHTTSEQLFIARLNLLAPSEIYVLAEDIRARPSFTRITAKSNCQFPDKFQRYTLGVFLFFWWFRS